MSEPDSLDLAGAAAEAGVHYDTLKKHWRNWSDPAHPAFCGFPAPYRYPPPGQKRGRLAWRASVIAAWKEGRERAFGVGRHQPPAAPHVSRQRAAAAMTPTVLKQRAILARLMERSA